MKDFPKPSVDAVVTQTLAGDAVEQLKNMGKNPHFWTEKALYRTQKQLLDATGPLTCLWADLWNKEAKMSCSWFREPFILLGSASHPLALSAVRLSGPR